MSRQRAALVAALISTALGVTLAVGLPSAGHAVPADINPDLAAYFEVYDTHGQRTGHRVFVLVIALAALAGPMLQRLDPGENAGRLLSRTVLGVFAVATCLTWVIRSTDALLGLIVGAALAATLPVWGAERRRLHPMAGPGLLLLGLAVFFLPGAFDPLDLSVIDPENFVELEFHYAHTFVAGRRLGLGAQIFTDTGFGYGLGTAGLLGLIERGLGPLTWGGQVAVLRAANTAVFLLAALAYHRHARGRWGAVLLALFLIGPYYWYHARSLGHPNLSGVRFIALPLALVLTQQLAEHRWRAPLLGLFCGLALCFNPETGVAISVGLAVYLWCRDRTVQTGALWFAGLVAGLVAFVAGWWAAFGDWLPAHGDAILRYVRIYSSGYGGVRVTFMPLALWMLAHSAYALVGVTAQGTGRPHHKALRAAAAAMVVVWFAYFANRPHAYNHHTYLLLYGIVLIDTVPVALRGRGDGAWIARGVIGLVMVPAGISLMLDQLPYLAGLAHHLQKGPLAEDAAKVQGVWIPGEAATHLQTQADALAQARPAYLSAHSQLMPMLSGVESPVRWLDPFSDIVADEDYRALGQQMRGRGEVWIDAPGTWSGSDHHQHYYARFAKDFLSDCSVQERSGWRIFTCP